MSARRWLATVPLFDGLADDDLDRIAALLTPRALVDGEVLCRRGDPGGELYVVSAGAVAVRQGPDVLRLCEAGQVLGELSILSGAARSADLVAVGASEVQVLDGAAFLQLIERHPSLARAMLAVLAYRFQDTATRQLRVEGLVRAYRERGHVRAQLDPLGRPRDAPDGELSLAHHGLSEADLDASFTVLLGAGPGRRTLRGILDELERVYCGALGVQYMHIDDLDVQEWLRDRLENPAHQLRFERPDQLRILGKLADAEVFEAALQRRFPRNKRFSLEGGETLIPLLDAAVQRAREHGVDEVVLAMSHRGRLNVLANLMGMAPRVLFDRLEALESGEPDRGGDVPFHLGFETAVGGMRLALCFNPSHLECVGPVAIGRARARQDDGRKALALVVHGDAAFAGQGIVQETLNLSGLDAYSVGGTVHVVLNNQIGFTTPPEQGRSTRYATDVARMLQVPVLHVDGERPEAVEFAIRLALDFRMTWGRDVVVDMYCFRRHGHAELDDPSFTQPVLARAIAERPPLRERYAANLVALGEVGEAEADAVVEAARRRLEEALERPLAPAGIQEQTAVGTLPAPDLPGLLAAVTAVPDDLQLHPKLASMLRRRAKGQRVDWATGELLAYASLVAAGRRVRLTGQDSERGTFAHRHAVMRDQRSGRPWRVLSAVEARPGLAGVHNSPLSEAAVMAFEFGYSLESPGDLVVWEAQFGDFANTAQVIVDQFVMSGAEKWDARSGLVLLLPHALEGGGPEHSSARIERYLQGAVGDAVEVCHLSTAAQVFHRLRAQAGARRPLIAFTPKRLLQHRLASSPMDELVSGSFQSVLTEAREATRVLVCSGHVAAELEAARGDAPVAIVRLERLHPFPRDELAAALAAWPGAEVLWVQEEPENMGAWPVLPLSQLVDRCVARPAAAAPATGWRVLHERQRAELLERALRG